MTHLYISAAHKSSGKTTLSIGLCASLRARGHDVQPFKKGPDYIDPMWLGLAAGRDCHNLDFYTQTEYEVLKTVATQSYGADISIIEGNKGLYDGLDVQGSNSNAALAKLLHSPVILVLDTRGTIRGVAPLLIGYQKFDQQINIAGVILNLIGGSRHERKLREVIEYYTDIEIVGAVSRSAELDLVERHLGLMPSNEDDAAREKITRIADTIASQVNLDRLVEIAQGSPLPQPDVAANTVYPKADIRIAVARDAAFGFYYPGDLEAFSRAGAELVFFDTLKDKHLPDVNAIFIGGGFPETQMQALEANRSMRESIHNAIENGMPAYVECGGLMYLSRSLTWNSTTHEMVGVIQGDTVMHKRPMGRGYIRIKPTQYMPWPDTQPGQAEIAAHEFHYSSLENIKPEYSFAFDMLRGNGIDGKHDGLIYKNLLACYGHQRNTQNNPWVAHFINSIRVLMRR